jgi:ferrochelatase
VSRTDDSRRAVLLLAHGAPETADQVAEFLKFVRGGRPLPAHAVQEIERRYAAIGRSPLHHWTERVARLLAKRLRGAGDGEPVYFAMRNWHPFIAEVTATFADEEIRELTVICLAPQNSQTSTGLYRRRLGEALAQLPESPDVRFIESWHDQPRLAEAFAANLNACRKRLRSAHPEETETPIVFTAHSVPERTVAADGDPYVAQVSQTAANVARAAGVADYRVAYQSQGLTEEPWIGPTVESQLDELAAGGARRVIVHPIGFLCDHVEILYDVDIVFRNHARKLGVELERPESLNDHPLLIAALADVVHQARPAAGATPNRASSAETEPASRR